MDYELGPTTIRRLRVGFAIIESFESRSREHSSQGSHISLKNRDFFSNFNSDSAIEADSTGFGVSPIAIHFQLAKSCQNRHPSRLLPIQV